MSTSARHSLYHIAEATYGVTPPTTPAFLRTRHTGTTLGVTKSTHLSEELRADRQIADFRHGAKQVGGDINFELSYGSFDDLLAAVFCGTWAADVLKAGSTRSSFSLLRHFSDLLSGDKPYHLATGVEFNVLELTIPTDGIVTGRFGVVGKDIIPGTTAPAGATLGEASAAAVIDSFTGSISEGGSGISIITELSLTLENGITPRFAIGSDEVTGQATIGRSNLTGQMTAFFENSTLLEKFLNQTASTLSLDLLDADGNQYTLDVPNLKYNGGQADTQGQGEITIALPFQAIYDATDETNVKLTRIAV